MNGPTFSATSAPARPPAGQRPTAPARPPHKPDADNPAARVLAYLRLHWLTILFAGALLGCGMAYGAWLLLPPKYESYALFRVSQVPRTVGVSAEDVRTRGSFSTDVKTYAAMIKYEYVYRAALRDGRIGELPTLKAQKDPIKYLQEKLQVSIKAESEIITLSLEGENPDDVRKIVDAMVQAYEKEVINKEKVDATEHLNQLLSAKSKLKKQLDNANGSTSEQPNALATLPGIGDKGKSGTAEPPSPFGPPDAKTDPQVKQATAVEKKGNEPIPDSEYVQRAMFKPLMDQRMKLEQGVPDLQLQIGVLKARVEKAKAMVQEVMNESAPPETESLVRENDPDVKKAQAKADRLRTQLAQKQTQAVDKAAESIRRMEREVEDADIEVEKLVRQRVKQADAARREPRLTAMQAALGKEEYDYNVAVAILNKNVKQIADLKAQLKDIPVPAEVKQQIDRDKPVTPDMVDKDMLQEELRKVSSRHALAEINASAPPRIVVLPPGASTPMQKDGQKQILGTVFAGLFGFVLVAAVCVGLEMRARKVSSLGELKAAAPAPVVGVVPHAPDATTARDPVKRAEVNESIDKLRAYVAQTWLARGATTVAVTSPLGDEGKSFTAFGLASSLAQAGMKTLLVDFDLRNPSLHTYAGLPNDVGVCELLRGESDFRKTIQVLPNGLHFLGGGRWSDDARQAAVGGRLEALLTRLKEPFDCVVLHADALLTVAESVEVARRSEVLLLCALYRNTRTPQLKKAAERAAAMEIPYTGIVYVGATANEALC